MDVKIINYCQESYRPDPETIVRHILARIPEKFLTDLGEVRIFYGNQDKEKGTCNANYVYKKSDLKSRFLKQRVIVC